MEKVPWSQGYWRMKQRERGAILDNDLDISEKSSEGRDQGSKEGVWQPSLPPAVACSHAKQAALYAIWCGGRG